MPRALMRSSSWRSRAEVKVNGIAGEIVSGVHAIRTHHCRFIHTAFPALEKFFRLFVVLKLFGPTHLHVQIFEHDLDVAVPERAVRVDAEAGNS